MALSSRDKWGVAILIALLLTLALALILTSGPRPTTWHKPEDSVFVKQRMINIEKSKP